MTDTISNLSDREIAAALRCSCTPGGNCRVEGCPFWQEEEITDDVRELLEAAGLKEWGTCNVDAMGLAAAERLEKHKQINCLNRLRDAAYSDAVAHGLWEMSGGARAYLLAARLILSEAHTLYETAFRLDTAFRMYPDRPDHDAVVVAWDKYRRALSGVIVMCLASCGEMEIDADMEVAMKMNMERRSTNE